MGASDENNKKKGFTAAERQLLYGLSVKIAKKHRCSSTHVHYIINGTRNANTALARKILKDLNALLELLRPEE